MLPTILLLSLFLLSKSVRAYSSSGGGPTCVDLNGQPVDKWVIFKYPEGADYAYWDPNTPLHEVLNASLNATDSGPLANTLNYLWLYYMSEYVMWNDETPNSMVGDYNDTVGHSKGVWMGGILGMLNTTGVFLQHSIPKWPMAPSESPVGYAGLPSNAWTYGQHIACFTVTYSELQAIMGQYMYIRPQIYAERGFSLRINDGHTVPTCQYYKYADSALVGFAKNAEWDNDLYAGCIAPTLQESLLVESWRHGEEPLGPSCSATVDVLDVQALTVAGRSYTTLEDHSKWSVGTSSDYVCFSDINRMATQYKRGGGAMCFQDAMLAADLRAAVQKTDRCSRI